MSKQRGASCRRVIGGSAGWRGRRCRGALLDQVEIGRAARRRAGNDIARAAVLQQRHRAGDIGGEPERRGDVEIDEISGVLPVRAMTCSRQCRIAGSFGAVSVAISSGRLTAMSAPACSAASSRASESLLKAIAWNRPVSCACSMPTPAPACRGDRVIFPTTPFEPPRADRADQTMAISTSWCATRARWRRSDARRRAPRAASRPGLAPRMAATCMSR